ncbi:RWD domain-containing protein 4 [Microplitis mediator]|uniref:RWD domain-containing protein 4 n=1 Tax=Microplitis mediator TaxID=375433 RepID=UPI002554EE2E|nr:RWD domain-containing protein 4 [Microplitis mediator]
MGDIELQEEEREVLLSIYEGDAAFKQLNSTTYQYKYGEDNDPRSFLLEIIWHETYPTNKPTISMETFYNKHILPKVKEKIIAHVEAEAEQWLGCAMTYTLFQSVQERLTELIEEQQASIADVSIQTAKLNLDDNNQKEESAKKQKKEQLTKSQKRRRWNKVDSKGEKPRGWDWVDIVKHLSQTGSKAEQET